MPNDMVPTNDILMQPVTWDGQEYFTSQYFHRQYIESSGLEAKYQQYSHFARLVRSIETYPIYVENGDILEIPWSEYKSFKNKGIHPRDSLEKLYELFIATSYNPLMLINKTGQIALTHHLDDEMSKQMSVTANTMVARQDVPSLSQAEALLQAVQRIVDHERQLKDHDERIKLLEANQGSGTGYVTILGYCRMRGLKRSLSELQTMGKKATARARELEIRLGKVPDERYGQVSSYPIELLDEIFAIETGQTNLHLVRQDDVADLNS